MSVVVRSEIGYVSPASAAFQNALSTSRLLVGNMTDALPLSSLTRVSESDRRDGAAA